MRFSQSGSPGRAYIPYSPGNCGNYNSIGAAFDQRATSVAPVVNAMPEHTNFRVHPRTRIRANSSAVSEGSTAA
jgi:hypothetical protein